MAANGFIIVVNSGYHWCTGQLLLVSESWMIMGTGHQQMGKYFGEKWLMKDDKVMHNNDWRQWLMLVIMANHGWRWLMVVDSPLPLGVHQFTPQNCIIRKACYLPITENYQVWNQQNEVRTSKLRLSIANLLRVPMKWSFKHASTSKLKLVLASKLIAAAPETSLQPKSQLHPWGRAVTGWLNWQCLAG